MLLVIGVIKAICSFGLLAVLPGMMFINIVLYKGVVCKKNILQNIPIYFILSLVIWILISSISYEFKIKSEYPIYILIGIIFLLILFAILRNSYYSFCNFIKEFSQIFSLYSLLVCVLALFIGYIAQFQTGDSDAFAHMASIRNASTSQIVLSCDWVIGNNAPIASTYGCSPWYLILGMVARLSNVDVGLVYPVICGALFYLAAMASYSLLMEVSSDVFIAKVSSIVLIATFFLNWFLIIGDVNYYSLDPLNNLIFSQHLISYIIFPVNIALLIRYLRSGAGEDLFLLGSSFFVVTRFHPAWLFWAPIILFGILLAVRLHGKLKFLSWIKLYELISGILILSLISIAGYIFCENTFPSDIKIISPLALWQGSGKNLFLMSKYLFIYDPRTYLLERAFFDFFALFILHRLAKESVSKEPSDGMRDKFKLLFWIYSGTLISVSLIIFNPLATYLIVTYMKSSVVLYRIFGLVTPFLSCIAIYAFVSLLKSKLTKNSFHVSTITMLMVFCFALVFWKFNYLSGLMLNKGGYYSTYASINKAPFSYFRQLDQGNIVIDTSMATAVAALTDLDPIITEVWRAKSIDDIAANKKDNDTLLEFSATTDELLEIIKRRKIKYIFMSRENITGNRNIKSHLELVHLKSSFDGASLWEVNEGIGR
jgi:hypothetical protein